MCENENFRGGIMSVKVPTVSHPPDRLNNLLLF